MKAISEDIDQKKQNIFSFANGDVLHYHKRGIYIEFKGVRTVLSTSVLNGGIRKDLKGVFNYNCLADQYACELSEDSYEKELSKNAKEIGLSEEPVTGLSTAAWMDYLSIQTECFEELEVTAFVTGGIDKNATRVGEPASYYEKNGQFYMIDDEKKRSPGTINIILYMNQNLSPGVLTRALVTCTEAKVTAVEELMIGSLYSKDLATGSGTDGTILIADASSPYTLTDAGEHSKLGELIGITVKRAVKEALYLQAGVCAPRQHKITERGKRYGITIGSLWDCYIENRMNLKKATFSRMEEFEKRFEQYDTNSTLVVWLSLYLHLLDQYRWGMLKWGEIVRETEQLTKGLLKLEREADWVFQMIEEESVIEQLVERAKRAIISSLSS